MLFCPHCGNMLLVEHGVRRRSVRARIQMMLGGGRQQAASRQQASGKNF